MMQGKTIDDENQALIRKKQNTGKPSLKELYLLFKLWECKI